MEHEHQQAEHRRHSTDADLRLWWLVGEECSVVVVSLSTEDGDRTRQQEEVDEETNASALEMRAGELRRQLEVRGSDMDARGRSLDERAAGLDARQVDRDRQDRLAGERDQRAGERELRAAERDSLADERDRQADQREIDAEVASTPPNSPDGHRSTN
jgi:hypothetical protein